MGMKAKHLTFWASRDKSDREYMIDLWKSRPENDADTGHEVYWDGPVHFVELCYEQAQPYFRGLKPGECKQYRIVEVPE